MVFAEELLGAPFGLEPVAVDTAGGPHGAKRIEEGDPRDALGPIDGELEADDAAPIVSDHRRLFDAERIHEANDIAGQQVAADPAAGLLGLAESAGIRREAGIGGAEFGELMAPFVGGFGEAMDKDDRLARASLQVVHADVAGLDEV